MIAILDVVSQVVHISLHGSYVRNDLIQEARIAVNDFLDDLRSLSVYKNMRAYEEHLDIGIRIAFGGDTFHGPVQINDTVMSDLRALLDYAPAYIVLVLKVIEKVRAEFPLSSVTAFFETAYFTDLPREEQLYALPQKYLHASQERRRGFNGLYHDYVAKHFARGKAISVVLDNKTTVCAMEDGKPQSISLGCTPLEGIMGRTSSGDVDPGIVLQYMKDSGASVFALDELLKKESGFVGLTGYDLTIEEFMKLWGRDKKIDFAFEVFQNHMLKYIGEAITVLGSFDTLVFVGRNVETLFPIVIALLNKMRFLGISLVNMPISVTPAFSDVTRTDSAIRVSVSGITLHTLLCEDLKSLCSQAV